MSDDCVTERGDRILRSSVPDRWKNSASSIGGVQSYIAEMEQVLAHLGYRVDDEPYFELLDKLGMKSEPKW